VTLTPPITPSLFPPPRREEGAPARGERDATARAVFSLLRNLLTTGGPARTGSSVHPRLPSRDP